jgi:ribosomal protein S18 acetylase RimI-like enzyme
MGNIDDRLPEFKIRKLAVDDYDALIILWQQAELPFKPSGRDQRENIARELKQSNAIFLVADKDGEIIGSAFGTHDGRKGWINRVAVAPHYRRKGIAERLVREVEHLLDQMGIRIIACLIEDWNKESMEFFEKMGYQRHHDIFYFTKRKGPGI